MCFKEKSFLKEKDSLTLCHRLIKLNDYTPYRGIGLYFFKIIFHFLVYLFIYVFNYNVLTNFHTPKGEVLCAITTTIHIKRISVSLSVKLKVWDNVCLCLYVQVLHLQNVRT